jgi:hypothetical protein
VPGAGHFYPCDAPVQRDDGATTTLQAGLLGFLRCRGLLPA